MLCCALQRSAEQGIHCKVNRLGEAWAWSLTADSEQLPGLAWTAPEGRAKGVVKTIREFGLKGRPGAVKANPPSRVTQKPYHDILESSTVWHPWNVTRCRPYSSSWLTCLTSTMRGFSANPCLLSFVIPQSLLSWGKWVGLEVTVWMGRKILCKVLRGAGQREVGLIVSTRAAVS